MTDCITDQIIGLMMDWIMSTEIRNFAWLPRIKSVWHNGVQAPLGVFFFCTQQKWLYGVLGQKMGLHSILSRRLSFGWLCNIPNFHWTHVNFFTPPPHFFFKTLFFCKQFPCFIFQTSFFWSVIQSKRFWAKKYFQWGLHSIMSSRSYFGSSHIISNFS